MNDHHPHRHDRLSRLVFGLAVIAIGIVLTLDKLDVIYLGDYWHYWPVLLIVFGLTKLFQPPGSPGRGFGGFVALVGAWWLAYNLEWIDLNVWDAWPILVVVVGGSIVWRALVTDRRPPSPPGGGDDRAADVHSTINASAILGSVERRSASNDFRGGSLTSILGGCEIDLRQARAGARTVVIDVTAFMGGIDIKVPQDWEVVIEASPVLGGVEDKTLRPSGEPTATVLIKGSVILGGVEVSN